jgi:hypothetical protein
MRRPTRWLLALTLAGTASVALAYVLPAEAIFERFEARRARPKADNQEVSGRVVLFDGAGVRQVHPATHTLRFPGACRLDLQEDAEASEPSASPHVTVRDGKVVASTSGALALLTPFERIVCALLGIRDHGAGAMARLAARWKIDLGYTGLTRLEGDVVYVVGAPAKETTKPALWFRREKVLPVLARVKIDGVLYEVRLLGYDDPATGELHPREMQLWLDGTLRVRFVSDRLDQNVGLDPTHFGT